MPPNRIASIDQFRGFAIFSMVLANFLGGIHLIPAWLKHAPDIGLTVIDLIAPFFIFAIGLTYGLSFQKRMERDGGTRTYSHFLIRYLAILGIGAIISAGETALGINPTGIDWGVLQAIGVAGIAGLLVIRLPLGIRAAFGLLILLAYQLLLDSSWLRAVLAAPHGGLFGALSWAAMLILATCLGEIFHHPVWGKRFVWMVLSVTAVGIALAFFTPLSKNRVSSSYVLVSLGASALLFLVFHWVDQRFHRRVSLLRAWGKNPLLLYCLHYLFIGLVFLPRVPFLYTDAPLWLVLVEMALLTAGLSAIAGWMERRNFFLSL